MGEIGEDRHRASIWAGAAGAYPDVVRIRFAAPVLTALVLVACGGTTDAAPARQADNFDATAAWSLIKRQVATGQRPAGSPQLRKLGVVLRDRMPHGRFESIPGEPGLRNVVATVPGKRPAIVI